MRKAVVDLVVRRCDRAVVRDVKVIPDEDCVSQHKLLVDVMAIK